jgi:hypothetical protein
MLVVVACSGFAYLRSYQPLVIGTGGSAVWPHRVVVASFDAFSGDGGFTQSYVRWAKGDTVHMRFPLWNDGHLPVTIEGPSGSQTDHRSHIRVEIVGTGPIEGPHAGELTTPFAPFVLSPNSGVQLFVDVTMARSVDKESAAIVRTVDVVYQAAWMTHRVTLFIDQSLYLCGGPCPP